MTGWTTRGMTDDVTTCELCGKAELRGTVRLVTEDGEEIFAGTTCAARKVGTSAAKIRGSVESYSKKQEIERHYRREWARKVIAHFEPVENGRGMQKREAWYAFSKSLPVGGPVQAVADILAEARAVLSV